MQNGSGRGEVSCWGAAAGSAGLGQVALGFVPVFDPFNVIRRQWSYTAAKVRREELCSLWFQTSKSADYHRPL